MKPPTERKYELAEPGTFVRLKATLCVTILLVCIVAIPWLIWNYLPRHHTEMPYASPTNLEVMRSKAVPVTTYIVQIKHGEYWYNLYRIPVESDHPLVIQDSAATEFPNVRVRHD